ncbi:MAG: hypothetical protein BWY17_05302 [Deltaproteobacteria bacterium ADurb.Bin207]|nr:MAG: hypothetical protein BWY17_05302 [Deltaproteobacteria bacterium ADurb.Bin207]
MGCGEDEDDPAYLGPVDGGGEQDTEPIDGPPPVVNALLSKACTKSDAVLAPSDTVPVRSLSTLEGRGMLTLHDRVRAVRIESDGCPSTPISSFAHEGSLEIDAFSAIVLPGARSLVATAEGTVFLDSEGNTIEQCLSGGDSMIARMLVANASGRVAALFAKSPVAMLDLSISAIHCSSIPLSLSPAPSAIAAVALDPQGGLVTVEQATYSSSLVVARYDANGVRVGSSSAFSSHPASKLCSATGLVDTPAGVFVTDTTCRRVVLFDGDALFAAAASTFDDHPRGAALSPDQRHVLIALTSSVENGSQATFESITLP